MQKHKDIARNTKWHCLLEHYACSRNSTFEYPFAQQDEHYFLIIKSLRDTAWNNSEHSYLKKRKLSETRLHYSLCGFALLRQIYFFNRIVDKEHHTLYLGGGGLCVGIFQNFQQQRCWWCKLNVGVLIDRLKCQYHVARGNAVVTGDVQKCETSHNKDQEERRAVCFGTR